MSSFSVIPSITIFVRHHPECDDRFDPVSKRCRCWKFLRYRHNGKQYKVATKERTWSGAERVRREVEDSFDPRLQQLKEAKVENYTIAKAVELFLAQKSTSVEKSTLSKYTCELGRLQTFMEQKNIVALNQIELEHILEYRKTWMSTYGQRNPTGSMRQKVQERMKGFFHFCTKAGYLRRNPTGGLREDSLLDPVPCEARATRPLEPEEYERLLAAIPSVYHALPHQGGLERRDRARQRMHAFLQTMRHTGMAVRDTALLERSNVVHDPKKKITRVLIRRQKTRKRGEFVQVSVVIPPEIAKEINECPNAHTQYVFWNTGTGAPQTVVTNWIKDIKKVFVAAGMPEGHTHQLRDTFAVEMLKSGAMLQDVSRALGHTSIMTTEGHYAAWVQSRQDRLDDVIASSWAS